MLTPLRTLVALLVTTLLIGLAAPGSATARPAVSSETWGACGASSPENKVVRVFARPATIIGPSAGTSTLLCGNPAYGYRHVADRHGPDWQSLAFYTGENWRDMADFAITQILAVPQPGSPMYNPKNNTWAYKAPLQIKADQELYDQLVGYLAAEGTVEENLSAGTLTLRAFEQRTLDPPLRLHATPAEFGRHLRAMTSWAAGAFPEVPPIDAAWRLFLVHLAEGVWTAGAGETELALVPAGVVGRRPDT